MMVEAQLRAGNNQFASSYAVKWSYDAPSQQESVSTSGNNYSAAAYPTTFLYQWGDAYGAGDVWQVDGPLDSQTCVERGVTNATVNPLQSSRGGRASFVQLFKGYGEDMNAFRYTGRSRNLVRGVQADVYVANFVNQPAIDSSAGSNMVFTYNVTVYMYPQGWSMVGRSTAADMKLPFRVVFSGAQINTNNNRQLQFTDVYNLFELFPASDVMKASTSGTVDSIWFQDSPSNYQCPAFPKTKSSSSSLSGGAVAGIVIGVLFGVALLVAFCCYVNRGGLSFAVSKKLSTDESTGKWSKQQDSSEMTEI
jgi:hypothetical protein